ncbi:hypothetical protein EV421DRAFT_817413 [Armillaria borealis]|uniref:Uncharacterized protein n=1 Tax=Armillaria borealis TaxID=47425 RepID=A0AA39IC52_9AGAR|nr:hypothetical protein EV421DRAFT_817413 [Armillaria borealis]
MIDGGAFLIVFIAGLRYTIVSGTRLLITPQKKLDQLDKALDEANKIYDIALAKGVVPAATQVTLSTTQDDIIDAIYRLDKTRWGHLKNRREYKRIKKLVIVHCNNVKVSPHEPYSPPYFIYGHLLGSEPEMSFKG